MSIILPNGHWNLVDDGTMIHILINDMNSSTSPFYTMIQSLLEGIHTLEGRQQGRMNVQDPILVVFYKIWRKYSHESRENHQIYANSVEVLHH